MKLSIYMADLDSVLFDTDIENDYFAMVPTEDGSGLFSLKKAEGARIRVDLHEPTPGFFFGVAEFSDENEHGRLVFNEQSNRVGAYFVSKKKEYL